MFGRLIGLLVSFAIVVYLLMGVIGGNEKVEQSIEQSAAMQDQKAALESAGIDASDKAALKKALNGSRRVPGCIDMKYALPEQSQYLLGSRGCRGCHDQQMVGVLFQELLDQASCGKGLAQ